MNIRRIAFVVSAIVSGIFVLIGHYADKEPMFGHVPQGDVIP